MRKPVSEILERLRREPIVRTFAVDRAAVDEGKRTVQVAFASDKPVEHWFGQLKLSMNKKAMRADRLKNGAPLLMDHNMSDQIGVVESHSIGSDGIARAVVRFSESTRASEIFNDVQGGIRRNVSVGFMVHAMELETQGKNGGLDVYRSDSWEPYEVSIVSVPADISVGVGRSQNLAVRKKMENENLQAENDAAEIVAFASIFGEEPLARRMMLESSAVTIDDVRHAIRAKQSPSVRGPIATVAEIAERNGQHVQLARSIPRYGSLKGFTGEGAEERAFRFGQWVLGGPLGNQAARQWCQENGLMLRSAQVEGINEKGGYLVPEEFGNDLIDLTEKYGVFRQHAKVVPMGSDTRSDPRISGRLSSAFVGELTDGTESDMTFDRISLTAKKHMVLVPFSSELSEDSVISIGDTLANESARAFAYKEDQCGFVGDGTETYGGMQGVCTKIKGLSGTIANIAGLQVAAGNAYSEILLTDFEAVVGKLPEYADMTAKWFVSKKFYVSTMMRVLLAAGGTTPTEIEDARNRKFLGYPVVFAQVMPTVEANSQVCAILGDLSLGASFGDRRKITIAIDDSTYFKRDAMLFRATSRFDINVHDVGNAAAAAADRVEGPIVGLITAAS
jgi:HK97 family phage major capsid protein